MNPAWPPAASIPATTALPRVSLRPAPSTWALSAANATAIARTMLLVAPVTRAVLPAKRDPTVWTIRSTVPGIEWTVKSSTWRVRWWGGACADVQGDRHPAAHRGRRGRAGPGPRPGQREPGRHPRGHGHQQEPAVPLLPRRQVRPA